MQRDRRDGRAHRQEGQGIRPRHHPGRLRDAADAVPELRRRGEGELPPLRLHRQRRARSPAASRSARSRAAAPSSCAEVEAFLRDKHIGPLEGFRSKAGWPFTAELALVFDDEIRTGSSSSTSARTREREARPASRSTSAARSSLGACPKCKGQRLRVRHQLRLRARGRAPTPTCDFKSGKIILQQPVAREQMHKLLADRQDRPARQASSRSRRGASSRPAWPGTKEGKVTFEFEPRPGRRRRRRRARAPSGRRRRRPSDPLCR